MADLATIERALRNADAAGDHEAATQLAAAYRAASATTPNVAPASQPTKPKPSTAYDVIRGAYSGLASNMNPFVNGGGQLQLGANDPQYEQSQLPAEMVKPLPGSEYRPTTTAGKYAETIAAFAPGALVPGSAPLRAARALVPAIASETAGQAVEGTPAEPYARVIGALAGGGVMGAKEAVSAARRPTSGIQTVPQLKQAAQQQYAAADNAGLVVKGKSFKNMAADLKATLANEGIDATLHPRAIAAFNRIEKTAGNVTLKGIDILRQVAGDAAGSIDRAERRLGRIIKDKIDDYVGNLGPQDVLQGDAHGATDAIKSARDLWTRASKGEIIEGAIAKADASKSQFGASGYENALRTRFRQLANNDRVMRRFSAEEQDAIKQVANGTAVGNALRFLGKFSPHGFLNTMMTGGAGMAIGGPVGAVGALAAGEAGRVGATAITAKNAVRASEIARAGGAANVAKIKSLSAPPTKRPLTYAATIGALATEQAQGN